jgi:DNA-directed RNA polymerase specialized sigma subunit
MPKTTFHSYTTGAQAPSPEAAQALPQWQAWKYAPTNSNFQALADSSRNVIDAAIRNAGGDADELRIPALKLLRDAAADYDPAKGAAFSTHAFNKLKGLQRKRWEREFAVNSGERARVLQGRMASFRREFEAENGRPPEDDEVFSGLGVTARQAANARRAPGERTESSTQGAFGNAPVAKNESDHDIMMEALYEDAAADEDRLGQAIIRHYFGYNGAPLYSQTDIARAYGVSPVAVHKRIKRLKGILGDFGGAR